MKIQSLTEFNRKPASESAEIRARRPFERPFRREYPTRKPCMSNVSIEST
jgi:hypothetical protein